MRAWQTLSSEYALDVSWLRVRKDTCRLPNGTVLNDYYVWEGLDWVSIFALTTEDALLLVRQYRQAVGEFVWELPGGIVDEGEEVLAAGLRELREETGYRAERGELVARMAVDPPKATFSNYLMLAYDCRLVGAQDLERTEEIEVRSFALPQVLDWIHQGHIWAQTSVASIYRALDYLNLWLPLKGG